MTAAQAGRERAFESFFERHYPAVLAYARRRTDEATARDVASETFLVAWRRMDDALPGGLPWLYRTAGFTLRNFDRARRRAVGVLDRLDVRSTGRTEPDPADSVVDRDEALRALDELSASDRELLLLIAWEQLHLRSAAAALGCSTTAAAVRLHRARRRLNARLGPGAAPPDAGGPTPEVTP
jgi:RNA polymerase sigma-70 factor, ECF subfamily